MQPKPIDSHLFISTVMPALESRDADELAQIVKKHWTKDQLCELLTHGSLDARKVVCLTLGLVGCKECTTCLVCALQDADPVVNELAEHALWSIWFRCGKCCAMGPFKRGLDALEHHDYQQAVEHLTEATILDDTFAEAYNQRAIAHYMMEHWCNCLADCRQAVQRVAVHFGAWAGMGHCHAQRGELADAAHCYRQTLSINPQMHDIAAALHKIEQKLHVPAIESIPTLNVRKSHFA
ncbi:MAG: tetratricopeptide repeat protein [Phycisphaerales bacterium]